MAEAQTVQAPEMGVPPPTLVRVVRAIDLIGEWSGKIFSWLVLPMAFALAYEVISRYVFNRPTVWAYDVTWMLYGAHFMLGAAYTLYKDGHIRTDLFYNNWSPRTQGLVDFIGYLVFFFPGMALYFYAGLDRALDSTRIGERSTYSPWQPPIWPVMWAVPISAGLLLIQGVSQFIKSIYALTKGKWL